MKCLKQSPEGPELLVAFSSRRLDRERTALVEAHTRECAECAALVAAQRSVSDALDVWDAPPVSPDFDRKLYARIEQEVPWWDFFVRPLRTAFAARWVPVAAAAGLMIAVGLWVGQPGDTPAVPGAPKVEALPPDQAANALQQMQAIEDFSNLIHADADPRM